MQPLLPPVDALSFFARSHLSFSLSRWLPPLSLPRSRSVRPPTQRLDLPSLLPVGLGDQSGLFSKVYRDTFQQIVLRNADIKQILDRQANALKRIINKSGAPCWAPDKPSEGPCPVN